MLRDRLLIAAAVFASFLAYSAVRAPVPGPNEPHYLSKAKRYWDQGWCRGDLFLDSADAHTVFYQTVGLLTLVLPADETAWVGRIAALLLMAAGWTMLGSRLLPGRFCSLWMCWVYLAISSAGSLSGEWIVGGVEGKVFAYALAFVAMALAIDRNWNPAAACAGAAVSFHPVVGMWCVIGGGLAALARRSARQGDGESAVHFTPKTFNLVSRVLLPAGLLVLFALPGLVPALRIVFNAPTPHVAYWADRIQVFYRLGHHLDPTRFSQHEFLGGLVSVWAAYAGMICLWLLLRRFVESSPANRWFCWFVAASILIATAGLLIGWGPRLEDGSPDLGGSYPLFELRMKLMKFYPFRLADVMIPLALAVAVVGFARRSGGGSMPAARMGRNLKPAICAALLAGALAWSFLAANPHARPGRMSDADQRDWIAACRWIDGHTDRGAMFLAPDNNWAFKWFARRAEYVSHKDVPQDAAGIYEWNRRLRFVSGWLQHGHRSGFTVELMRELAARGITHVICRHDFPSLPMPPAYPTATGTNATFRVYRVPREVLTRRLPPRHLAGGRNTGSGPDRLWTPIPSASAAVPAFANALPERGG